MFIKESARMAGFTHDNILSLIGITVKDEKPCIILPYMENGDLHSYITDTRRVSDWHAMITAKRFDWLQYCLYSASHPSGPIDSSIFSG